MNAEVLLEWTLAVAEARAEDLKSGPSSRWPDLKETLWQLQGQRDETPEIPRVSKRDPDRALQELRAVYRDDVGKISLLLHHHFPDRFLYYRPSRMEPEIFDGLRFLAGVCPEFEGLEPVRKNGLHRYLHLNEALLGFGRGIWPDVEDLQTRLTSFLCFALASLFREDRDGERNWIFATSEAYFEELDSAEESEWSGHKEMAEGDLIFLYRTAPSKAITEIFEASGSPFCDPQNYWDVMVPIRRLSRIEQISFSQMRSDPILGQWQVIKRQFRGVRCAPVPDVYYNRLLELLPDSVSRQFDLEPFPVSPDGRAGDFGLEADFSNDIVEALLRQCGLRINAQAPCRVQVGHQTYVGRVDYTVGDEHGPLTLVECKLRIRTDGASIDLAQAADQAKSYAVNLGLPSFVVAAPEGFWIYSLNRARAREELFVPGDQWMERAGEMKRLLLSLRSLGGS